MLAVTIKSTQKKSEKAKNIPQKFIGAITSAFAFAAAFAAALSNSFLRASNTEKAEMTTFRGSPCEYSFAYDSKSAYINVYTDNATDLSTTLSSHMLWQPWLNTQRNKRTNPEAQVGSEGPCVQLRQVQLLVVGLRVGWGRRDVGPAIQTQVLPSILLGIESLLVLFPLQ